MSSLALAFLALTWLGTSQSSSATPYPGQDEAASSTPAATANPSTPLLELDRQKFPLPQELVPNVVFWTKVYAEFDNDTMLLHDELHLQVIYAAIDLSQLMDSNLSAAQKTRRKRQEIRKVEGKYHAILRDLAAGRPSADHAEEQARVERMFASVPGNRRKYTAALERFRTQTCLKNRFAEAIERSGTYLDTIEEIFAAKGLPLELTRLPFVESLFQWNARSSASAGGIWQFVPGTAKSYMKMELEYDERYNPLMASDAAARLLSTNYDSLKTWPLAITAYNHGRYGMQRAVRSVGTRDLGSIVKKYKSRTFGFASRNFYSEFIAAAQVYANRDHYFPGVEPDPLLAFDDFRPSAYVDLPQLALAASVDLDTLNDLNPALSRQIWTGNLYLPKGYSLRVPSGLQQDFTTAYASIDGQHTSPRQVGFHYRVRPGDTLSKIASRYGASVSTVQRANRLSSPNRIRVGQKLLIPPGKGGGPHPVAVQGTSGTHVVRRGETLSAIASSYGTSTRSLMANNGLASANRIYIGQRLSIPKSGASANTSHTVRRGETLASIARKHGTNVGALQRANRISNHIIRPGQVLVIPR